MNIRVIRIALCSAIALGGMCGTSSRCRAAGGSEEAYQAYLSAPKATEEEMKKIQFRAEFSSNYNPPALVYQIHNGLADSVIEGLIVTITWNEPGSQELRTLEIFSLTPDALPLRVMSNSESIFRGEEILKDNPKAVLKEVRLRKLAAAAPADKSVSADNSPAGTVPQDGGTEENYRMSKDVDLEKAVFTDWQTLPDSQVNWDEMPKGAYKAYLEGRNNKGLDEYRSVISILDLEKYESSDVRSQMTSDEFFERGVRLKREGWERMCLQVFIDGSGTARYQAVWLKPRNGKPKDPIQPPQPGTDPKVGGQD